MLRSGVGAEQVAESEKVVMALAYNYQQQGMSAAKASDKAMNDLYGKVNYIKSKDGSISIAPPNIDGKIFQSNFDEQLKLENLKPIVNVGNDKIIGKVKLHGKEKEASTGSEILLSVMQSMGYKDDPLDTQMGGGKHSKNSYHYQNRALDINQKFFYKKDGNIDYDKVRAIQQKMDEVWGERNVEFLLEVDNDQFRQEASRKGIRVRDASPGKGQTHIHVGLRSSLSDSEIKKRAIHGDMRSDDNIRNIQRTGRPVFNADGQTYTIEYSDRLSGERRILTDSSGKAIIMKANDVKKPVVPPKNVEKPKNIEKASSRKPTGNPMTSDEILANSVSGG